MTTYALEGPEKDLFDAVRDGRSIAFDSSKPRTVDAKVLRHIILGLPVEEEGGGILLKAASLFGISRPSTHCRVTGVGISLENAIVEGRLTLDSVIGPEGGPICPLEFNDCEFHGGFSGAHGRFSRLRFHNCRFADKVDSQTAASIDLADAAVYSDLDLAECRPLDDTAKGADIDRLYFEDAGRPPYAQPFWVRLAGARIDGDVKLSKARLRRPRKRQDQKPGDPAESKPEQREDVNAVNLSGARLAGDLLFEGGRSLGRIIARRAHIGGDVWMTGARLNGDGCEALVLQSATVEGFVVLKGERDGVAPSRFASRGEINFHGARLGSKLRIGDADLYASCEPPPGIGALDDLFKSAPDADVCLCLQGARVDGSVYISASSPEAPSRLRGRLELAYLEVANEMRILNVELGMDGAIRAGMPTVDARSLVAKELRLSGVTSRKGDGDSRRPVSIDLEDAKLDTLKIADGHFSGRFSARSLQCRGDVEIGAHIGGDADLAGAVIEGSLDISQLRIEGGRNLSLRGATIARSLQLRPKEARRTDEPGSARDGSSGKTDRRFFVDGEVDLKGLACETLDDEAGWLWGRPKRIKSNHFVYRRADWHWRAKHPVKPIYKLVGDWIADRRDRKQAPWRWIPERLVEKDRQWSSDDPSRKPSHRIVADWLAARRSAGNRLWRLVPRFLASRTDYWQPWQIRRNWIYQQFETNRDLDSISRHEIERGEYRPQPFEQAIRVARAEGHEAFATQFEILKNRIEWRLFNLMVRWWLGFVAIAAASGWLIINHGPGPDVLAPPAVWVNVLLALIPTLLLMTFATYIYRTVGWGLRIVPHGGRVLITWSIFVLPTGVLLWWSDWWRQPFHFVVAALIFVAVRWISVVAHAVMRFAFGYLRRPVQAIVTLLAFFALGWWGVHLANTRNMLVINAEPVAPVASADRNEHYPRGHGATGPVRLMGSQFIDSEEGVVRELSCAATMSEPLYALDVLIPIVDLGEESRCEVRRLAEMRPAATPDEAPRHRLNIVDPERMTIPEMAASFPDFPLNDHRFWWWMKAIFAIAGWIIVSLALLTFAQVNKMHAEPPGEQK